MFKNFTAMPTRASSARNIVTLDLPWLSIIGFPRSMSLPCSCALAPNMIQTSLVWNGCPAEWNCWLLAGVADGIDRFGVDFGYRDQGKVEVAYPVQRSVQSGLVHDVARDHGFSGVRVG